MQPNQQYPPTPPPFQPGGAPQKGYEFLNPQQPQKKSLLPSGGSKKSRIIIVAVGAILLLITFILVASLLGSAGKAASQDVLKSLQQQQELIRISGIGAQKARDADTLNLAVNAKLTLESDKADLLAVARDYGFKKVDNKLLAGGLNTDTDQKLTQAEQANRFDEVFENELRTSLLAYEQTLRKILDGTNKKHKPIIERHLKHITLLLSGKGEN